MAASVTSTPMPSPGMAAILYMVVEDAFWEDMLKILSLSRFLFFSKLDQCNDQNLVERLRNGNIAIDIIVSSPRTLPRASADVGCVAFLPLLGSVPLQRNNNCAFVRKTA